MRAAQNLPQNQSHRNSPHFLLQSFSIRNRKPKALHPQSTQMGPSFQLPKHTPTHLPMQFRDLKLPPHRCFQFQQKFRRQRFPGKKMYLLRRSPKRQALRFWKYPQNRHLLQRNPHLRNRSQQRHLKPSRRSQLRQSLPDVSMTGSASTMTQKVIGWPECGATAAWKSTVTRKNCRNCGTPILHPSLRQNRSSSMVAMQVQISGLRTNPPMTNGYAVIAEKKNHKFIP